MNAQRSFLVFLVKLVHSLVFVVVSLAILVVWYAVFTGTSGPIIALAVAVILLETAVYLGNGLRCPLTGLTRSLGDVKGDDYIADIFLPEWFVPWIPPVCGTLAVLGVLALLVRTLTG